jgi:hypothetical protein
MNQVLEVLKYLLPSLVVFITTYALIRMFLDDIKNKPQPNDAPDLLKFETHKALLPLKLQAYERIILYLERINPESLIMRNHRSGMTALDIQRELLKNIREEFEHNHSQQLYLNPETWEAVRHAKDEMTKLVKFAGSHVEGSTSALAFSETFLKVTSQLQTLPTQFAKERIRLEIKQLS